MAQIAIEYCVECRFLGRALETAQRLLEEFSSQIESLKLVPGTGGIFDVTLDGQPIFRIDEEGKLPWPEEIQRRVAHKLRSSA